MGRHSPSAEWALRGLFDAQGYAQGIAKAGSSFAATPAPSSPSSAGGVTLAPGAVQVTINADPKDAGSIKDAVLSALGSAFEQLAIEGGAL